MQCEQIKIPPFLSEVEGGIEWGIVSENKSRKTGIAIIPDHYVTWIMRVKRIVPLHVLDFGKPRWEATGILALFTNSQIN